MPKRRAQPRDRLRERIAEEAARIMATEGVRDYLLAKRKAADRLGVSDRGSMPRNDEIEAQLISYRTLFESDSAQELRRLRQTALEAMDFLRRFEPRLAGPVLTGSAGRHSVVSLHLFADSPEELDLFLIDKGIPFDRNTRRHRYNESQVEEYPGYGFLADDVPIELTLFPSSRRRQAPLSPVDGRPMARASREQVARLLEEEAAAPLDPALGA